MLDFAYAYMPLFRGGLVAEWRLAEPQVAGNVRVGSLQFDWIRRLSLLAIKMALPQCTSLYRLV